MIRKFFYFFRWPIILYILGIFFSLFKIWSYFPWIDIPMHILGGFVVAYSFTLILTFLDSKKLMKIKSKLVYFFIILSSVALITVFWEFYEFILTYFFNLGMQGTLVDTMCDLFLGLLGAMFLFIFKKIKI